METFGQKLARLRRTKGMTQDALADELSVSRQSVSKWESDAAYPETDKLVCLADVFGVTLDYLVRDVQTPSSSQQTATETKSFLQSLHYEYKSKRKIGSLPLVHINIGLGIYRAKGVIAIGNIATGILSIGILAFGLLSFGALAFGLIAIGAIAVGGAAAGAFAIGLVALGAISLGILSVGAIAVGVYSNGALAVGLFATGDVARGKYLAVGREAYSEIVAVASPNYNNTNRFMIADGKYTYTFSDNEWTTETGEKAADSAAVARAASDRLISEIGGGWSLFREWTISRIRSIRPVAAI